MKTACEFSPYCLSSFLTFRYVASESAEWIDGVCPTWPCEIDGERIGVRNAEQLLDALQHLVDRAVRQQPVGLLLSGGIDSAILAALLPPGTPAYTVRFQADQALDETHAAATYAKRCGLQHHVVAVAWDDYLESMDYLMRHKYSPLHAVEVGLYQAARAAANDGIETLMVGNGADSTFGGLNQLLSRDWTLDEFIQRYTFIDPARVLNKPAPMKSIFTKFAGAHNFDVVNFLKEIHGRGIIQAFDNAISAADCAGLAPYELLTLDAPLDLARIRHGEPKYLLRAVFEQLYPGFPVAQKIAFARPMDCWMKSWKGPTRPEFRLPIEITDFTGEQKWLLYCLERFMNIVEAD